MADKVGLGSGSVPPQNIPPAQADASKAASPAGAGGDESPSEYFYEIAQSGYEFLAKYAQAAAEAQQPKELKPEDAAAHFDQAEKEFQSTYKDAGTGPAAEAQAKSKIDAMQAAIPALMERAKDPEVQAYLKEFQSAEPAEAESGDAAGATAGPADSQASAAKAPKDPAKAKAAFEILSRLRALEKAKHEYYSKYRQGSQDDLARRSLAKQQKAEAMLKGMGEELRSQPDSAEAQRLLVEIDNTVGDYVSLHRDLQTWKQAAQGLKDPAAKVEELNAVLQEWARQYDKMLDLSAAEVQAEAQAVKDEIVAVLRDHPTLISTDKKPIPNGAEHVRVMLDRIFPPPPGGTIVQRDLLSGLSLEGMGHFAQLSVEADAAMMSAMQKSQAGDAQGAKEDYLKALGAYTELRDEAAARAMDREIRKLLGGGAPIEDYKMLGRIHAELKGSGLKLEAELKEEIASPEWMGFFLESSMKVTNRHLRGADSKVADGQDLAEILEVAENLIQAVKIRQEAGIVNDDPVQLMEIDRLQLVMRKNADAKKLGSKERLELREKIVRLDVVRFPEYVDALTRPIRGAWEPGLLDRIAHPERSGAIGVGIIAEDIGKEMLEHLQAWEEDLDHSELQPKEELDRRADMSAVLSLFYPLTKVGENPPLHQEQLTPLIRRNAEHLQALAAKAIAEQFPMVAGEPELLQAMGEDILALSQEAVRRGDASFAALLRNPKGLEAFAAMSYKAHDLETRAKTLEAKVEAAKLKKLPEEKFAKWQAEALQLRMQSAELYSKRGGPPDRVKTVLKPAMDFFEGVAADPNLTTADRAESLLDIAKLYQAVRLPEEAARVYEKVVAMERDLYLSGKVDEGLRTAATLAQGHRALLKAPPDYDAAKKFFQSLPGVEEAQRSYDAIVAYQRSQRLPKVLGALEAVAAEYAQKLEQRKGKAEAAKFRAEFKARAEMFRGKLESGDYRAIEELFAAFGYVRHDAHQGRDFYKWAVGESDSIDWREFNQKSLDLLQAATNPEATDRDFAALGLEMGTYLGSAGDFDLFQAGAKDVAYFGAASQILDMMGNDRYVGTQAKSYRTGIANRSVIHETSVFLGNLSVVGAESLSEAGKSAALWLVPAGVGRLAGAGARLLGAGERLSVFANVAASSLSGLLVESAWTGNWDAFSAKGLATTGTTTFISYFGYRHIARLSQKLGEAAKRSATFGQRVAGQAAIGFSTRVMLEMGEFTAGGLFEAGMSFAQEGLGIQKVSELEKEASLILRIFSKMLKGGFEEKRENLGEGFAGRLIDYSTGGWLQAVEQKVQLQDRRADMESAARGFGWDLDFNAAKAWIDERRPVDGAKAGERELAALLSMDPGRLRAIAKDPSKITQAKEAVQKLYPDLDPNSWEAQLRAFQVLDYFETKGDKGIAEQFAEFQKTAESLGIRSQEHLSAYYELAFRGLTPKQARKMAKELAATPNLNDKLDVLVEAYVQPGAKLTANLRDTMRAEVVLSFLEEAVSSKKSPGALLERDVQAATPLKKTPEAGPDAGPYRTQANFAGLPWTLGDIYEGLAKLLGITTQKAAKEQGWKQLDAWVEATSRDPGPNSDAVPSETLAKAVAKGGKKTGRAADVLIEGSGITHPGLAEKLQLRFERMGLDAGQISALAKSSAKFQKGLRAIAEGLLGKGALDTPQGQLMAAELLLKAIEFGAQGKDPSKSLQYFKNLAQDLREGKPRLDAAAEKLLQARDVHQSPAAYSVKTTLFLKALLDSAAGKKFEASLAAWTEPAVLGRVAEVLLETEATGVSTPQGRLRIAKKFIAMLGTAKSPKGMLSALYPRVSRPIPLNPQGIASLEEVGGQARTKYAEIEVEGGKAWLFPNPGRRVEVYDPVAKSWKPAKEGQPLKSGTWIRQEGKDLGRKLFTLTPEGDVYLEEIGTVAGRMEEGGSVMRALHENFPAWFGAGEALSLQAYGDLTKIVPEFFRRVERDRNPDWDRWYTEIADAVSVLEPAVQALPAQKQAEFRVALMRKLAGGALTAERARAIAEELQKSPLDPALFAAGQVESSGDFFGEFEAQQPKEDYRFVFGDDVQVGVHGLPDPEVDVFGDGADLPTPSEEVVPNAIAAAEEDWWLGTETAPDTDLEGVDAVENVVPFLPSRRSKAPTVEYPDLRAAARLGQPEVVAKMLGQEAMAEGMRQMESALQSGTGEGADTEPAQILIRLPEGQSREDAMIAISEKADALQLTLDDFGGPGELVFLTPSGRRVFVKVEVEGAAPAPSPATPLFQESDKAEDDAHYDRVLQYLQGETVAPDSIPPETAAFSEVNEKDLLRGPARDRMDKALSEFLSVRVDASRMKEIFPEAAEVFRTFHEARDLILRIERSEEASTGRSELMKQLEAMRPRIESADALWIQSQSVKYYMSFLDTAFTPLVLRTHNAPAEAEVPVQAIQLPEWIDSPDFELKTLDDAARARQDKPPRFAAPAMTLQTSNAESVAILADEVVNKAEALGLEFVAKRPGKLEFRTPMGGGFEVRIEAAPRRVQLDPQADKIPLGPKSYLERSGDRWIFKNPGKESWFIGAEGRGVITGEPILKDGDLLVSFEGATVIVEDPVLRAKPAFRTGSGVSALKIPEHPFDKISSPQELRDHGIRLGRNFDKVEVTYKAKPGEKLFIRRPGETEPIEVKPLNEAASGGKSAKARPVAVVLQAGDVLEIHTVAVGKKNPVASFPFGTYGALLGQPKLPLKKPVLAGQLTEADREAVTLQDLPALGQVPERPQVAVLHGEAQIFLRPYQVTDAVLPGSKLGKAVKAEPVPGEKGKLLVTFELETLGVDAVETLTLQLRDTEAHRLGLVGPTGKLLPKGKVPILQVSTLRPSERAEPQVPEPVVPLLPGRHPIAGPVAGLPKGAALKIVLQGESRVAAVGEFLLEGEGLGLRAVSDQVQVFAESGREGPGGLNAKLAPKDPETPLSQGGDNRAKTWILTQGDVIQVGDRFFAVKGKPQNLDLIALAGDPRVISKQEWERRAKEAKAPTRAYLDVSFAPAELEISGARVDSGADGALYLTQGKGFTVVDAQGRRLTVLQQDATALQMGDKVYYDEGLGTTLPSHPVYLGEVVVGEDEKPKWKPGKAKPPAVDRQAATEPDLPAVQAPLATLQVIPVEEILGQDLVQALFQQRPVVSFHGKIAEAGQLIDAVKSQAPQGVSSNELVAAHIEGYEGNRYLLLDTFQNLTDLAYVNDILFMGKRGMGLQINYSIESDPKTGGKKSHLEFIGLAAGLQDKRLGGQVFHKFVEYLRHAHPDVATLTAQAVNLKVGKLFLKELFEVEGIATTQDFPFEFPIDQSVGPEFFSELGRLGALSQAQVQELSSWDPRKESKQSLHDRLFSYLEANRRESVGQGVSKAKTGLEYLFEKIGNDGDILAIERWGNLWITGRIHPETENTEASAVLAAKEVEPPAPRLPALPTKPVQLDAIAAMATIEVGRKLAGFPLLGKTTLQEEPGRLTVSIGVPGRGYATELAENIAARLRKEHPKADVKVVQGKDGAVFVIARAKGSDRVIAFNLRFKTEASPAPEDMLAYAKGFEEKHGEKFAALARGDAQDSPESTFIALSSEYHAALRPREALMRLLEIGPKVRAAAPEMEGRLLELETQLAKGSRADLAPDSELTAYLKAKEEMAVYEKALREYEKGLEPPTLPEAKVEVAPDRPGVDFEMQASDAFVDREAVTEINLPVLTEKPAEALSPLRKLMAGAENIALIATPYLPLVPVFFDAVAQSGLLGGGAQLAMGWFGNKWEKLKGVFSGKDGLEGPPNFSVAGRMQLKPQTVAEGSGDALVIGGESERGSDGKLPGNAAIPGLPKGVKIHYQDEIGVARLYPVDIQGLDVVVRLKADGYQEKKLRLDGDGVDFQNGDQVELPHPDGKTVLALRVRKEGSREIFEIESSHPILEQGVEGLGLSFPPGKSAFTFGERNEDDRRATAAGGVGAINNPQTYGKIERGEDGSFLLHPLAPIALRQIFLVDAHGAETPVTQATRIAPGQMILVKNLKELHAAGQRILFRFEPETGTASIAVPSEVPQAMPPPPADAVTSLEAGTYVWEGGLDLRDLPESTDVAVRYPSLTGEDVLALLRGDGQDFWVLPRSQTVQVLDASGRPLALESGFDSQTGEKISQGYRVPEVAYLSIGNKLFAWQGAQWLPLHQDPWSGRNLRQTGDLEFEIPAKGLPAPDAVLTPVAGPMPAPEMLAAAAVDPGAGKIPLEKLPLAIQDNQPGQPRRAAYAQNQPTPIYGSFAAHTDEGLGGKPVNEDSYGVLPEYGVGIVADGMGGMGGGDKASAVAVGKLAEIVKSPHWDGDLKQALILAGRAVNQEVNPPNDPSKNAGTTAVVQRVVQKNGRSFAEIAHVGDAGALVLRPKPDGGFEVVFATREQSLVAEYRDMGALKNTMEMRWSPKAHVVSGGLGLRKDAKPEFASVELRQGDWTLLFSDGIGDNFSKDELSALVQGSRTPEEARDRILASLRLKMERLQAGQEKFAAQTDVFLVPVQEKGAAIDQHHMVPIDGLPDYYLGKGGKVVGRAVHFKDAQGQARIGVAVPWAQDRFAVRNAKGEMEYFQGQVLKPLEYFLPVDRYKADNVSLHVYKHELSPIPDALDSGPTNPLLEEEWRFGDELGDTPQTPVSEGLPTTKMAQVQDTVPPLPTVKMAPLAEEIPPTFKSIQAVSAPKHPEEPGTPSAPILARVGNKQVDLSLAKKEPQVVYREGPVVVELSVDALGRYLLKGKGFNWGTKPIVLEFEGKKYQLSRSKPSAPPLEAKSALPAPKTETKPAAPAVAASDFKAGLSESKGELAASDIPSGVEMELVAMPTALWDRDSDKNEVRVEDVLAEKPVSVGTLTREEAGGLTLQIRKGLPPGYEVDLRDSGKTLKKGAKGSAYDPIALAEGDRIGIGPMGIMKFVVARDEKGRLVLRPDGIDQKVRVHLSAAPGGAEKSDKPSPFKKMIEEAGKTKATEEPALPAFSPEERLALASQVSPKERLGIVRDDETLTDPRRFQEYLDSTKRLLGPSLSEQLGFLLVDSPEGRAKIQKLREAVARRAGHSYPNVDKLREYAAEALLQEGIDISERSLKEMGLKKSLGVVNLTLSEAFLPQLYPNDVPVALISEERNLWVLGDAGFSALFRPQHPAVLLPGTTLGEIREQGYLQANATGNILAAGHQFLFKPHRGGFIPAAPVVQLEGQLFSLRQGGDVRAVFTFTSLANPRHQIVLEGPLGTDPKLAIEVAKVSVKQAEKTTALEDIIPLLLLENPQNIPVKLPLELRAFQILGWIADQNGKTPRAYSAPETVKEVVDKSGEPIDMQNTLFDMEFFDRYSLSLRAMDRGRAASLLKMVQDSFGASLDPEQLRGPEPFSDAKGKGLRLRLNLSQPSGVQSNGKMLEIMVYGPN